tara:strand:+ start:2017 stop:2160 length:144 start_codon:yes stop_codon:yes gene_type:complete
MSRTDLVQAAIEETIAEATLEIQRRRRRLFWLVIIPAAIGIAGVIAL